MDRAVLITCWPWLVLLGASCLMLWLLVRSTRTDPDWRRLRHLHRDEAGSVQALSFVLTLPMFVWVMMLVVQVSQLMIGSIVVHYAAFAAARAAVVWIPARLVDESENVIGGGYSLAMDVVDGQPDSPVVLDETSPNFGPRDGWLTYIVDSSDLLNSTGDNSTGDKGQKIAAAAILAIASICPSSPDAGQRSGLWGEQADDVANAYLAVARSAAARPNAVTARLKNKLAYAVEHTRFRVYFRHPNSEPPLKTWRVGGTEPDWTEFRAYEAEYGTELGYQDQVTITLDHDFALLPGPGRLLAKFVGPSDPLATALRSQRAGSRYFYPLSASATLGIEGEKPAKRYDETNNW